jgi:hypothetical protein
MGIKVEKSDAINQRVRQNIITFNNLDYETKSKIKLYIMKITEKPKIRY